MPFLILGRRNWYDRVGRFVGHADFFLCTDGHDLLHRFSFKVLTYGIQKYVDLFQFLGNTIKAHKLLLCLVSETFTAEFFPQLARSASQEGCYCRLVHSSHLRRCWSYSDWDSVSARLWLSQSCKNTEHLKCSPKTFWKLSKRSIFWGDRGISTNTKYTK